MSNIDINGNIGSLLNFYKHERNIFGRCPHCREPFRVSDVKLTYGKEPPRDLLTGLKRERDKLISRLEDLEVAIQEADDEHIRDSAVTDERHADALELLNAKWTDKVDTEVDKRLGKRVKEIRKNAIARSRAGQLGKTLEKVVPMFPGFGHHPYDVRPVFDPVDFVVFDGYFQGEVTDIVFVEFKTGESRLNSVQGSIRAAVQKKRVHFEQKRLRAETIKMLIEGRRLNPGKLAKGILE